MQRHTVISVDGHVFLPGNGCYETDQLAQLDAYVERRYLDDWRSFSARLSAEMQRQRTSLISTDDDQGLFAREHVERFEAAGAGAGGLHGLFDSDMRTRELEGQGICAEVLFPNTLPFEPRSFERRDPDPYPPELQQAGARAYNRWLADFCSQEPDRRAGLAAIDVHDVDAAVTEVAWAREHGLAGVVLPTGWWLQDHRAYYDERYEPLWAACAAHALPVHFHGGATSGEDFSGYGANGLAVLAVEATMFYGSRAFPYLVFGGVLDRHPDLRVVFTESRGPWLALLQFMDHLVDAGNAGNDLFAHVRNSLSLRPSEYFRRQVFLGASMMSRDEALHRHEIGLRNLMWGADYPHYEGTWPRTTAWLRSAFGGLPPDEVHAILAENPARLYGFDLARLQPVADRIGPGTDALATEPDETLWEW